MKVCRFWLINNQSDRNAGGGGGGGGGGRNAPLAPIR